MERGLVMIVHAIIVGLVSYGIMLYGLKQSPSMAENRSILLGTFVLAYMIMFGHEVPSMQALNKL